MHLDFFCFKIVGIKYLLVSCLSFLNFPVKVLFLKFNCVYFICTQTCTKACKHQTPEVVYAAVPEALFKDFHFFRNLICLSFVQNTPAAQCLAERWFRNRAGNVQAVFFFLFVFLSLRGVSQVFHQKVRLLGQDTN